MKTIIAVICLSIYTILEFVAYVPQIVKLLKTKCADDLSILSWCTWVVADLSYLGYVILETPEIGVVFVAVLDLVFIITVFALTSYYQKHNKKCKRLRGRKHL